MNKNGLKTFLSFLQETPLHPQWFAFRDKKQVISIVASQVHGKILDIGCMDQYMKRHLDESCDYTGLDYLETVSQIYDTRPDVFGDAQCLPFANDSFDSVLLLDVLEHVPAPGQCVAEIRRILKPSGVCVIHVPFMYPIHDAPFDYQRWTIHGLGQLMSKSGLKIVSMEAVGKPIQTSTMLLNISLVRLILNWYRSRSPKCILAIIFIPLIFVTNFAALVFSSISGSDEFMPHGYRLVSVKRT